MIVEKQFQFLHSPVNCSLSSPSLNKIPEIPPIEGIFLCFLVVGPYLLNFSHQNGVIRNVFDRGLLIHPNIVYKVLFL